VSPGPDGLLAHIPGLRRYARLLTGEKSLADDLVQDTLERACRTERQWPHPDRLRPWLLSVMHNLFVSQVRARRTYAPDEAAEAADPVDEPRRLQIRLDLLAGLQRLSPAHREVLLLVCVEDLGYEAAAQVLGVPIGTVMSRLSRARAHLRAAMDGTGGPRAPLRRIK
jgi:RNA polymerase sigma factor (sigma-70 family)